jgi:hypothetical protein
MKGIKKKLKTPHPFSFYIKNVVPILIFSGLFAIFVAYFLQYYHDSSTKIDLAQKFVKDMDPEDDESGFLPKKKVHPYVTQRLSTLINEHHALSRRYAFALAFENMVLDLLNLSSGNAKLVLFEFTYRLQYVILGVAILSIVLVLLIYFMFSRKNTMIHVVDRGPPVPQIEYNRGML